MTLADVAERAQSLSRQDKYKLVQQLLAQLAGEEGIATAEHPIWSPLESHEAAAALEALLARDHDRSEAA